MEPRKKIKILLIEDDVFMIELLSQELTQSGFDIAVGITGTEGIEKYHTEKPDLILLDLLLPDVLGFEVLRAIRKTPDGAKAKVIVLSNLSESKDQEEAKRLGVVEFLVKANYELHEIIDHVRKSLKIST